MRNVLRNVATLTTLACERLKRGSLGDPTHPGLRIMARPSGAKVWIYRFRDPAGKMAQLLIGSFPALSLADARSEWRNHRATRDKHGDPRDEVRRRQEAAKVAAMRGKGYTLTRAAESYRKERLSKLARGDEQWRILEREILPEIGSVLLAELKPSQVMAAIVPMRKRAPRVAAMGISALRRKPDRRVTGNSVAELIRTSLCHRLAPGRRLFHPLESASGNSCCGSTPPTREKSRIGIPHGRTPRP